MQLAFSRHGKPPDNAFAESCNGRFRDECLNRHWFASLEEARQTIEAWRVEYNSQRPHTEGRERGQRRERSGSRSRSVRHCDSRTFALLLCP